MAQTADQAPEAAARGTSQFGMRLYNERLILSLIRRHRQLTKVDIARLTGLSQQTTTVIINRLTQDGLLLPGTPQRGRVGQPAVPFSLAPDGALALGLTIGRRSSEVVLMDFTAGIRARRRRTYAWPDAPAVMAFARDAVAQVTRDLPPPMTERIAGLGVAMPSGLWNWADILAAPPGRLDAWRDLDVGAALAGANPWPVHIANDATAACGAELIFGSGAAQRDFVYFYLGAFVGAGVVLDGALIPGRTGNAGAIGSMPVLRPGRARGLQQLIRTASIYLLEEKLVATGQDAAPVWESPDDWSGLGPPLHAWLEQAAAGLAQASVAAASVLDFEAVLIDGNFPDDIRHRLVTRVRDRLDGLDREGLSPFVVAPGVLGRDARAIGAAALPFLAGFARDRDLLFRDRADAA